MNLRPSLASPRTAPLHREGLRPSDPAHEATQGMGWVVRMDPRDGSTGIFRDALVVASLSHPADPASLSSRTFRVEDHAGPLPARLRLSPDGRVLIWRGGRLMAPNVEHRVFVSGVRDAKGRAIAFHWSRFVSCDLCYDDPSG